MSAAVSARYRAACPTCGARGEGDPCRAKSGRVTDAHRARIDAAFELGGVL